MPFPQTQSIPIQFSGGLNSKLAKFALDQPYMEKCENGVFNLAGQIDKRAGFTAIPTSIQGGGNISSGASLTTFNGELLLLDGQSLFSYQAETQTWISRGSVFSSINDQIRILNSKVATQSNPDVTTANGISVYVWEDDRAFPVKGNGVRYSVYNNTTGTIILSDQQLYPEGSRPKVVTDGTNFTVFYAASANNILTATIPVARPNTVATNIVQACNDGLASTPFTQTIPYDVAIWNGAPLLAYASQTGIRLGGQAVIPGALTVTALTIAVDSLNRVWMAYCDGTDTRVVAFDFAFGWASVFAPVVLDPLEAIVSVNLALIAGQQPGNMNLTVEVKQSGAENINNNFCNNYTLTATPAVTFVGQMRGVGLASKPFAYGGNIFVTTVAQSNLQATYFTQCLTQGQAYVPGTTNIQAANDAELATNFALVSKHSPQNAGGYRTNTLLSQADSLDGAGAFLFAGQRKGPFTTWQNAAQVNLGCAGYSVNFANPNAFNSVQANNNLHLVGGVKKIYDGVSCVEDNFCLFPENADGFGCAIALVSGGNLAWNSMNPSQYQYLVVYEWPDNYGQIQRSTPSIAATVTTGMAGQAGSLTGPMLRITEKTQGRSPVIVSIYRTQANLPIFYKVTNDANPLVNDPTTDFWTFVDTLSDSDIAANENLYTGSQLANTAPPPSSLISLYQQRLMTNSTEDPGVLWYSQNKFEQDQYNTLALDWSTSFVEGVDSRLGNEITAIGLLDNSLAIFKETSIFLLQGDGPNALGTSGQFNDALLLVSDTGCSNQNSLVFVTQTPSLPGGLLFQSPKGIYLLGRDQSIAYIGAPVEQYNDLTITSANLLSKTNEIVFTTAEGTTLVYNYFFNAWSTWANLPAVSACVWQGALCILGAEGTVMVQDLTGTVFADTFAGGVSYPVVADWITPFLKFSGMQGYQAVLAAYVLGTLQAPHVLQVQAAYDYNPSFTSSVLINSTLATNRWGGNPVWGSNGSWGQTGQFSNYQFQLNIDQPRCQAIQFRFTDVQAQPSKAFSLNGLVLEVLALPGSMRVPQANKVAMR